MTKTEKDGISNCRISRLGNLLSIIGFKKESLKIIFMVLAIDKIVVVMVAVVM